jgi:ech hydrogenase subunit D
MLGEKGIPVTTETVAGETAKIKYEGYRLVTLSCVEIDEGHVEILYHFGKNLGLAHFRLAAAKETVIPSISTVFSAAFLVENEIQDLFNVRFSGLTIDFNRTLYLEEITAKVPFCRYSVSAPAVADEPEAPKPVSE